MSKYEYVHSLISYLDKCITCQNFDEAEDIIKKISSEVRKSRSKELAKFSDFVRHIELVSYKLFDKERNEYSYNESIDYIISEFKSKRLKITRNQAMMISSKVIDKNLKTCD